MSGPSDKKRAGGASTLDDLVREAKEDLEPRIPDAAFAAMEDRILARMAKEPSPLAADVADVGRSSSRGRALRIGALVLAAAAAVAVVMKRDPQTALLEGPTAPQVEQLTASALRSTEGGEVRVGGHAVSAGHVLRAGDVLEVDAARAVLERPRKVTWLLESRDAGNTQAPPIARTRVKSAGESLILGLEDGAIEAQVTPVPTGEAFAVDIAAGTSLVRVAVHGTHLRVARTGSRVVVDLTEGVVSIGVPPRTGSTYGTLVTAPSHVEFDATNLDATLRIDHAPAAVRAPISLVAREAAPSGVTARNDVPAAAAPQSPPAAGAQAALAAPGAPATVPRPSSVPRPASDPSRVETAAKPDPSKPAVPAREAIAAAVRDCAAARSRPENVRATVSSKLTLKMAAGGAVETATFEPPLLPDIQTCAAVAIYKAKLEDAASGTLVTIPIDFSY